MPDNKNKLKPFHKRIVEELINIRDETNVISVCASYPLITLALTTELPAKHRKHVLDEAETTITWLKEKKYYGDTAMKKLKTLLKDYRMLETN